MAPDLYAPMPDMNRQAYGSGSIVPPIDVELVSAAREKVGDMTREELAEACEQLQEELSSETRQVKQAALDAVHAELKRRRNSDTLDEALAI